MNLIDTLTPPYAASSSAHPIAPPTKKLGAYRAFDQKPTMLDGSAQKTSHPPLQRPSQPVVPSWVKHIQLWTPPADILTRKIEVEFAVEGLIQAGKVGVLVSAGGTGKTTLLITLGICIALKLPFLGCAVKQGSFVLLSNDDSQSDLLDAYVLVMRGMKLTDEEIATVLQKVRIISLQGFNDDVTFATTASGHPARTGMSNLLIEALYGITDLVGISLDTLRQFSGGSSNDEEVIKIAIRGATYVASKTGAFVVLPHHTGKQNYRDTITDMYAGSGSAAIADNCRFVLLLQTATWSDVQKQIKRTGKERGDPLVLRPARGSIVVKMAPPIFLCRQDFLMTKIAGHPLTKDQKIEDRDFEILTAVRAGASSKNAIYGEIGGRKNALLAAVDSLKARGLLEHMPPSADNTGPRSSSEKIMISIMGLKVLDAAPNL